MDISAFNDIGNQIQAAHGSGGAAAICAAFADPMSSARDMLSTSVIPLLGAWTTITSKCHPAVVGGNVGYFSAQNITPDMVYSALENAVTSVVSLPF